MKALLNLGLTKAEVKVYLALLQLGASKTGEISKKAKVSRSKIYEILDKLIDKGLVSYVVKENVKYFEGADPKNLKNYIEHKRQDLKTREKELDKILPSLKGLQRQRAEKHVSNVYEGYAGIKTVFNDVLNSLKKGQEYYAFAVESETYDKDFSLFISNYHRRRQGKGIKVKLLTYKNLKTKILKSLGEYKGISFKFTNDKFPTSTLIFGNKIFIFTWKNKVGTLIESKEIAKRYKDLFLDIWGRAKT